MEYYKVTGNEELDEGMKYIEEAKVQAVKEGKWTRETKEKALYGAGMEDSATTGVVDILQMFFYHNDTDEKTFREDTGQTWEEYIDSEFESNFSKEYKEL